MHPKWFRLSNRTNPLMSGYTVGKTGKANTINQPFLGHKKEIKTDKCNYTVNSSKMATKKFIEGQPLFTV